MSRRGGICATTLHMVTTTITMHSRSTHSLTTCGISLLDTRLSAFQVRRPFRRGVFQPPYPYRRKRLFEASPAPFDLCKPAFEAGVGGPERRGARCWSGPVPRPVLVGASGAPALVGRNAWQDLSVYGERCSKLA